MDNPGEKLREALGQIEAEGPSQEAREMVSDLSKFKESLLLDLKAGFTAEGQLTPEKYAETLKNVLHHHFEPNADYRRALLAGERQDLKKAVLNLASKQNDGTKKLLQRLLKEIDEEAGL